MNNTRDLLGASILITRPKTQALELETWLQQAGATIFSFPTLQIVYLSPSLQQFKPIEAAEYIIFSSQNAVLSFFAQAHPSISDKHIFAVGPASANMLKRFADTPVHTPKTDFSTEGLLELPEFKSLVGKHVVLIKGVGGHRLLAEQLCDRGALVSEILVYRREIPSAIPLDQIKQWQAANVKLIIVLSNEGLQNLYDLLNHDAPYWLLNCQLLVASRRQVNLAQKLGFTLTPLVLPKIDNMTILETVKSWYAKENLADI